MDADIIGTLYDPPAIEGGEPVSLPGWHVNVTRRVMIQRPALEAWRVEPETLRRVWAGDDPDDPTVTVALKFDSEAEGRAALGLEG
jgi:hypothetical protein